MFHEFRFFFSPRGRAIQNFPPPTESPRAISLALNIIRPQILQVHLHVTRTYGFTRLGIIQSTAACQVQGAKISKSMYLISQHAPIVLGL